MESHSNIYFSIHTRKSAMPYYQSKIERILKFRFMWAIMIIKIELENRENKSKEMLVSIISDHQKTTLLKYG